MARLIDADALVEVFREGNGADALDHFPLRFIRVRRIINESPTVDAIPVEWLKQQFYDNPNSQWAEKCRDVFTGWQKWQSVQKEQEAR